MKKLLLFSTLILSLFAMGCASDFKKQDQYHDDEMMYHDEESMKHRHPGLPPPAPKKKHYHHYHECSDMHGHQRMHTPYYEDRHRHHQMPPHSSAPVK